MGIAPGRLGIAVTTWEVASPNPYDTYSARVRRLDGAATLWRGPASMSMYALAGSGEVGILETTWA